MRLLLASYVYVTSKPGPSKLDIWLGRWAISYWIVSNICIAPFNVVSRFRGALVNDGGVGVGPTRAPVRRISQIPAPPKLSDEQDPAVS